MIPQVLFLGANDWANLCHGAARAINHVIGAPVARVFTLHRHPFGYRQDLVGPGALPLVRPLAAAADWIVSTGDGDYRAFLSLLDALPVRAEARIATTHCGSAYRQHHAAFDRIDAQLGASVRFIAHDLYRLCLGDSRARPILGCIDDLEDSPAPELALGGPVRIAHSPSNRATKGTAAILEVLERYRDRAEIDLIEGVDFVSCLARRGRAHLFIDQIAPAYGGYGQSSIEAMAQGCAVLCDHHNVVPEVSRFYPRPPIVQVGDAQALAEALDRLLGDPHALLDLRRACLTWARTQASRDAVGSYWLEALRSAPTV